MRAGDALRAAQLYNATSLEMRGRGATVTVCRHLAEQALVCARMWCPDPTQRVHDEQKRQQEMRGILRRSRKAKHTGGGGDGTQETRYPSNKRRAPVLEP